MTSPTKWLIGATSTAVVATGLAVVFNQPLQDTAPPQPKPIGPPVVKIWTPDDPLPEVTPEVISQYIQSKKDDFVQTPQAYVFRRWVSAVINNATPEVIAQFEKDLKASRNIINKQTLTEGLLVTMHPEGFPYNYWGGGSEDEYSPDPTMQVVLARIFLEAGADARYVSNQVTPEQMVSLPGGGFFQLAIEAPTEIRTNNFNLAHSAAAIGNLGLVKLFVDRGADPKAVATDFSPYHFNEDGTCCVRNPDTNLIVKGPLKDFDRRSVFDVAAGTGSHNMNAGNPNIIHYLAGKGATPAPNARQPSLISAALAGNVPVVRALLNAGVSPDVEDIRGKTAMDYLTGRAPLPMLDYSPDSHERNWYSYDPNTRQSTTVFPDAARFLAGSQAGQIRQLLGDKREKTLIPDGNSPGR